MKFYIYISLFLLTYSNLNSLSYLYLSLAQERSWEKDFYKGPVKKVRKIVNTITENDTTYIGELQSREIIEYDTEGRIVYEEKEEISSTDIFKDRLDKYKKCYEYDKSGYLTREIRLQSSNFHRMRPTEPFDKITIIYNYDNSLLQSEEHYSVRRDEFLLGDTLEYGKKYETIKYSYNKDGLVKDKYSVEEYNKIIMIKSYDYDDNGNMVEERFYNYKGEYSYSKHYKYDSQNRLIEKITPYSLKVRHKYVYFDSGYEIEESTYHKTYGIFRTVGYFHYNKDGKRISSKDFHHCANFNFKTHFYPKALFLKEKSAYDDKGNIIKQLPGYNGAYIWKYKYDSHNNILERQKFELYIEDPKLVEVTRYQYEYW